MNKKTLIGAIEAIEKNDTITLADLMDAGNNSNDSIEVLLLFIKTGLVRDAGEGVFAVHFDEYKVKKIKKDNGLFYRSLSLRDAKAIADNFDLLALEVLKKASQGTICYSDLDDGEKERVDKLYDFDLADVIMDEVACKLNDMDLKFFETAVSTSEGIKRRAEKKERRKAYREQMRRQKEAEAGELEKYIDKEAGVPSETVEDGSTTPPKGDKDIEELFREIMTDEERAAEAEREEEEACREENPPVSPAEEESESTIPDFSAISMRAGELIGKKKKDKSTSDIFRYSFQGIAGDSIEGELDSSKTLVALIMSVSRIANERRAEVFGSEMFPFEIVRAEKTELDKIASVYVKLGREQTLLSWKKPLIEQIRSHIFAQQCLELPVEFPLVLASESTGN